MLKLSHDLMLIRKEKRLSKHNVFEKCRVPLETIEAIENGSIFTGKTRNKTYQRSYIRTYSKAIGISDDDIVQALNEHEKDKYYSSLADKYLEQKIETPEVITDPEADKTAANISKKDSQKGTISNPQKTPETPASKSGKKISITPQSQEKTLGDIEWEDQSLKKPLSTTTSDFASSESHEIESPSIKMPPPPDVQTVDWATKVKDAVYQPQRNRLLWILIAIVLALVIATVSIYWYWQSDQIPENTIPPTGETVPMSTDDPVLPMDNEDPSGRNGPIFESPITDAEPETPEIDVTPSNENGIARTPEDIISRVLAGSIQGDTLFVTIYALHGNLEPIRVQSDVFSTASFRPYWVEHHQAMRFEFIDEIIFQGSLARMALILNGHVIDDFSELYSDGSRISLTRDFILENAELQVPDETPFEQIPTPSAVVDRPRFSP